MQLLAALFFVFLFRARHHFISLMFGSEQLFCLHMLIDFFSDPFLHFQCNLPCLHTGIFFIIHRFHIMDLHSYRLCGASVKGCITVKQCHRNNRCFRPCGRLKGARLKRKDFIAIPAPRSLRKYQKILVVLIIRELRRRRDYVRRCLRT